VYFVGVKLFFYFCQVIPKACNRAIFFERLFNFLLPMRRVVVTGIGVLTPIGNSVSEYLDGLQKGISGAGAITHFDATNFKTKFAAEVKGFNPELYFEKKEVRKNDRFTQFAMAATDEALKDAGLDLDKINLDQVGVILGSGIGGLGTLETEIFSYASGNGIPGGMVAIRYGFGGVNYAPVSACATSSHAIINAYDCIRLGRADVIVSGGSEAVITATAVGGFTSMKAMSERNDDPQTASRPYDKERDGFVLGEGAGTLILEEYEHAKARGAKIYCEIIGTGMTCDAYHMSAPHPDGVGVIRCMQDALREAKISASAIDYVNTHGTSTPLGDNAELKAIAAVFGDAAYKMNISATKSMTGHLLGAAGAIEAVAGILAMENDFVPPTINHFTDDPEIDSKLNLTFNEAQHRKLNVVLSNTFGFGGHNTSILMKKI
jgi:3-oxoacyl-[acyl-carrier-protein] synthase II